MEKKHYLQMQILRELIFTPEASFSELNTMGLSSDQFNYHLSELVKDGMISKLNKRYTLTAKGKEYANRMDTENAAIEKQPKVAIMVLGKKRQAGKILYLIQQRLKHPYYGYLGFITGKVRFGDTIINTARREYQEETGLHSGKFELRFILHEHVYSEKGELLEDKIFHVFLATSLKGELKDVKEGKNKWMERSEFLGQEKIFYDEADILAAAENPKNFFIERSYTIKDF
jgi:8-oxo-dGTP pyrophosphatase MutT (NUDIX family)